LRALRSPRWICDSDMESLLEQLQTLLEQNKALQQQIQQQTNAAMDSTQQFLRHLRSLASANQAELPLDRVAILADKIIEVTPPTPLHPAVHAVQPGSHNSQI
ncbi:hypothetical protein L9F63_025439, partial [Diploptera punctata]